MDAVLFRSDQRRVVRRWRGEEEDEGEGEDDGECVGAFFFLDVLYRRCGDVGCILRRWIQRWMLALPKWQRGVIFLVLWKADV